jgi:heat-inducible transcriptional repressor
VADARSTSNKQSDLGGRERAILRAIVEHYVETAEPVASGALSQRGLLGDHGERIQLSSATIRNSMAKLEAAGYIVSPHTSAGRIPSTTGIALYTRTIMQTQALTETERSHAEALIVAQTGSTSVLSQASRGLSRLVTQLAVCVAPSFLSTVFDHIEFVRVSSQRLVAIFVARTGSVYNRIIDIEKDPHGVELERINAVMREFCGLSLIDIRARLASELLNERARFDELYRRALELGCKGAPEPEGTEMYVDGTMHCLAHREIALDAERLKQLLRTVEEKTVLLRWLERLPVDAPSVTMTETPPLEGMALVSAPYATPNGEHGVLAILGPLRMNYARIVPMVAFSASTVTRQLLGT